MKKLLTLLAIAFTFASCHHSDKDDKSTPRTIKVMQTPKNCIIQSAVIGHASYYTHADVIYKDTITCALIMYTQRFDGYGVEADPDSIKIQ